MKRLKKILSCLLVFALASASMLTFASCVKTDPVETGDKTDAPTGAPTGAPTAASTGAATDAPTGAPTDSATDTPTGAPTDSATDAPTGAPTAAPTDSETQELPTPPEPHEGIMEVTWLNGYVGSSTNKSNTNKIAHNASFGSTYSYSEVFTVPKAGTKVWFTDDKSGFGSDNAYVFSSWKLVNGEWVIDLDGANYACGDAAVTSDAKPGPGKTYTYVTAKDNENLRVCYRSDLKKDDWKTMKQPTIYFLENSGEAGTAEEALKIAKERAEWLEAQRKLYYSEALDKISMYALGDSYFGGSSLGPALTWPSLLAKKYNMKYTNYGKGGTLMTNHNGAENTITDRWQQMSSESVDLIVVNGGRNDYNRHVPIGKNEDTVTTTFKGAMNSLISNLRKKYPGALIIFVDVWNYNGTNNLGLGSEDYANAMKEVCAANNVPCFDAHDKSLSHVDMTSASFREQYCLGPNDVSHLNEQGHRLVLQYFEKFIADEYAKFVAAKAN